MVEETDYGGCWHKVSFSYGRYLRKHENKIFDYTELTTNTSQVPYRQVPPQIWRKGTCKRNPRPV